MILRARQHLFEFPRRPVVIGPVRVSWHEDPVLRGEALSAALVEARGLVDRGAEIIAVRSGAPAHEADALSAFVSRWRESAQAGPVAVQTSCPEVAQAVLVAGGDLLVETRLARARAGACFASLCAEHGAALIIEYTVERDAGSPVSNPAVDVLGDALQFFEEALSSAAAAGLSKQAVVLGMRLETDEPALAAASLRLAAQMERFHRWERPLLLTDIPALTSTPAATVDAEISERQTAAMVARMVHGVLAGVQIFQGGNVEVVSATLRTISAVLS